MRDMVAAADELLTVADIVALKKAGVADLNDVPIFATGIHHDGEREFTDEDLDAAVRNFHALSEGDRPLLAVPIGVGHESDQSWIGDTGLPAVGRIRDIWRDPKDGLLHAKLADIPRTFAEAIDLGVYFNVSAELYDDPPLGCPGKGCTLRRVVLVGADIPAVKRLLQLPPVTWRAKRFTEKRRWTIKARSVRHVGKSYWSFSEVVMDRAALAEQLKAMGWTDETIATLDNLPDEDFAVFVNSMLAQAAGVSAPPEAAAAEGDPATPPSREQMISDLAAAGEDPAALEAMGDADLLALWTQKVGGMTANSEGLTVATSVVTPAAAPVPAATSQPAVTVAQFSEMQRQVAAANKAALNAQAAARRAEVESNRRAKADRSNSIKSFCERWVRENRVTPAEVDPKATVPNLYHRLANADIGKVHKFGEQSLNEFDATVAEIEARPAGYIKMFNEKIAASPEQTSRFDQARKAAQDRHAARSAGANGKTVSQRLGLLQHPSMR